MRKQIRDLELSKAKDLQQKARTNWVKYGDENSAFFHGIINANIVRNKIDGLLINGRWETDPEIIKDKIINGPNSGSAKEARLASIIVGPNQNLDPGDEVEHINNGPEEGMMVKDKLFITPDLNCSANSDPFSIEELIAREETNRRRPLNLDNVETERYDEEEDEVVAESEAEESDVEKEAQETLKFGCHLSMELNGFDNQMRKIVSGERDEARIL